jgi:hypothetical protein
MLVVLFIPAVLICAIAGLAFNTLKAAESYHKDDWNASYSIVGLIGVLGVLPWFLVLNMSNSSHVWTVIGIGCALYLVPLVIVRITIVRETVLRWNHDHADK